MNESATAPDGCKLATVHVFGLPFAVADYQSALEHLLQLIQQKRPSAVALCSTHVVKTALIHEEFRAVLNQYDVLLPDGMPLVWMMDVYGAKLRDRVYGPYLMRYVVERTPRPCRHFLFGGSSECLEQLKVALLKLQPGLELVGSLSPPFRTWTEADEQSFAETIGAADPDFVWVALGGGKQETWIARNQHRYSRGVFLAVGDAFELLAGRRAFAPAWMQRVGLAWAFRLGQEPGRLWKRYLLYNSLILAFALRELMRRLFFPRRRSQDQR